MRSAVSVAVAVAVAAVLSFLLACEGSGSSGGALRPDLEKLCNAVERSGATGMEASDRAYTMAKWLAGNITSPEGRKFLQDWAKLGDDRAARAKMLSDAAARAGITDCPLVAEWK